MTHLTHAEYAARSAILFVSGYVCCLSGVAGGDWWWVGAVGSSVVALTAWGTAKVMREGGR